MFNKNNKIIFIVFCLSLTLLTACGGGSDSNSSSSSSMNTDTNPATDTNSDTDTAADMDDSGNDTDTGTDTSTDTDTTDTDDNDSSDTDTSSDQPTTVFTAAKGKLVFDNVNSFGNQLACQDCHSIQENANLTSTADAKIRAGHPLFNAINRTSYKNGALTELIDAANVCLSDWMKVPSVNQWTESSDDWQNLKQYLALQSDLGATNTATQNINFQIINPPSDLNGGDAIQGQIAFNETCAVCHGINGVGTSKARKITNRNLSTDYIAQKIRLSGPSNSNIYTGLNGGVMPFFAQDRMTDQTLINIATYTANGLPVVNQSSCSDADHSKVGQTMSFSTLAHDVMGSAEIIDNCTIKVSGFSYDGTGPAVYFYAGVNGQYSSRNGGAGFAIGTQLVEGTAYNQDSVILKLSSPSVLDDFNGLSVWCVDFDVSFGDGLFK